MNDDKFRQVLFLVVVGSFLMRGPDLTIDLKSGDEAVRKFTHECWRIVDSMMRECLE